MILIFAMIKTKYFLIGIALIVTLFSFTLFTIWQKFGQSKTNSCNIEIYNQLLPENILLDIETGDNRFDDLRKEKVLLIFLSTECASCQQEMQIISHYYPLISSKIKIFGVTTEDKQNIQSFAQKFNLKFPILIDKDGKLFAQTKVKCTPTNLIIENGIIKKVLVGSPKDHEM